MIYTDLTKKALKLCFAAHKEQQDKSGLPYVFHPFHLAEQMEDELTTVTALLHDVVEDSPYTLTDLREMGFPEYSVKISENTTKTETNYPVEFVDIPYPFNEDLWKDKAVSSTIATLAEKSGRSNFNGSAEIRITDKLWESVPPPALAASKAQYQKKNGSAELVGYKVYISLGSDSLIEYLLALIRHRLKSYSSSLPKFGCCHLYEKCSAAGSTHL